MVGQRIQWTGWTLESTLLPAPACFQDRQQVAELRLVRRGQVTHGRLYWSSAAPKTVVKHRVRNLESSTEAGRVETVNNNGHGIVRVSPRYWAFQEPSLTTWHVGTSLSLVREGTTGQSFVLSHFLSNVTDAYKPFRSLDKHVHHQYS